MARIINVHKIPLILQHIGTHTTNRTHTKRQTQWTTKKKLNMQAFH